MPVTYAGTIFDAGTMTSAGTIFADAHCAAGHKFHSCKSRRNHRSLGGTHIFGHFFFHVAIMPCHSIKFGSTPSALNEVWEASFSFSFFFVRGFGLSDQQCYVDGFKLPFTT